MRKTIFSSVFALALLATAGWGVNKSMSNDAGLNDLALKCCPLENLKNKDSLVIE